VEIFASWNISQKFPLKREKILDFISSTEVDMGTKRKKKIKKIIREMAKSGLFCGLVNETGWVDLKVERTPRYDGSLGGATLKGGTHKDGESIVSL